MWDAKIVLRRCKLLPAPIYTEADEDGMGLLAVSADKLRRNGRRSCKSQDGYQAPGDTAGG
jgi:hypothetical protein